MPTNTSQPCKTNVPGFKKKYQFNDYSFISKKKWYVWYVQKFGVCCSYYLFLMKKIHLISVSSPKPCQHRLQALRDGLWNPTSDRRFVWARVFFGTNPGIEKSEYVYIYIYIWYPYVYMYVYIYTFTYLCIYILYSWIQMCICIFIYTFSYVYKFMNPPFPSWGFKYICC